MELALSAARVSDKARGRANQPRARDVRQEWQTRGAGGFCSYHNEINLILPKAL